MVNKGCQDSIEHGASDLTRLYVVHDVVFIDNPFVQQRAFSEFTPSPDLSNIEYSKPRYVQRPSTLPQMPPLP